MPKENPEDRPIQFANKLGKLFISKFNFSQILKEGKTKSQLNPFYRNLLFIQISKIGALEPYSV
jgi:hypothetical protein